MRYAARMPRQTLAQDQIHPAVRDRVAGHHHAVVDEVRAAIAAHPVVIVGMRQNPHPWRARKRLAAAGINCHYLEYGSYFGGWRQRTALKMWSGWPMFPMIFVRGVLVGGADDLGKLIDSGELKQLLA